MDNINWDYFISSILDGKYKLDIGKTGSVKMFVKNQLGATSSKNIEMTNFRTALKNRLESQEFSVQDLYNRPYDYLLLLELGGEFINRDPVFIKLIASLFINIYENQSELSVEGLKLRHIVLDTTSSIILGFIESWKIKYQTLEDNNHAIYRPYGFLKQLKENWIQILLKESKLSYSNLLIAIIYLNEWENILLQSRKDFLIANKENVNDFLRIINDMEKHEGSILFDYYIFAADCKMYFPELYSFIEKRTLYQVHDSYVNNNESSQMSKLITSYFDYKQYEGGRVAASADDINNFIPISKPK